MDELTVIREFRADVAAADGATRSHAREKLVSRVEAERIGTTQGRRRRWSARRLAPIAAAAAVAIVVLALVPTWSDDPGLPTLLQRAAAAAVSTGPVLHAVLELPVAEVTVDPSLSELGVLNLASGRIRPVEWRTEVWFDPSRHILHERQSIGGDVLRDNLHVLGQSRDNLGNTVSNTGPPRVDAALVAFLSGGYEQALTDGSAKTVGDGVVDGRRVKWLRFPAAEGSGVDTDVAVDAESYKPLRIRRLCPQCTTAPPAYRVVALEGMNADAADFTPPARYQPEGIASYNARYMEIATSAAATALGRPTLWAGASIGGLELSRVRLARASTHSAIPPTAENQVGSGQGLLLLYGAEHEATGDERPYVSVGQAAKAGYRFDSFNFDVTPQGVVTGALGAPIPPEGFALVSSLGGPWSIQLRKNGVYIEIDSPSRELALDAVAALRPMTPTR